MSCAPPQVLQQPERSRCPEPLQQRQGTRSGGRDLDLLAIQPAHRPRDERHAEPAPSQICPVAQPQAATSLPAGATSLAMGVRA